MVAQTVSSQDTVPLRGRSNPQTASEIHRRLHAVKHQLSKRIEHSGDLDLGSKEAVGVLATKMPLPVVPDTAGVTTVNFFISQSKVEEEEEDELPLEKVAQPLDNVDPVIKVTKKKKVKVPKTIDGLTKKQRRALRKSATKAKRKAKRKVEVSTTSVKPTVTKPVKQSSDDVSLADKLQTTSVLEVFLDRLSNGEVAKARRFLRSVFALDCKQTIKDYDDRLFQMNKFISNNAERILGDSLVLEKTAYGVASPDAYLPIPQKSDAEWDKHDGPIVDTWEDKPYRVSQTYPKWMAVSKIKGQYPHRREELYSLLEQAYDDDNVVVGDDDILFKVGMQKRMFVLPIPANYMAWLELSTPITMTKSGRSLASMFGEGGDEGGTYEVVFMYYTHNEPLFLGDIRIGVRCNTVVTYVPLSDGITDGKCGKDAELSQARTFSSNICRQLTDNMHWPTIKPTAAADDGVCEDDKPYQNVMPWVDEATKVTSDDDDETIDWEQEVIDSFALSVTNAKSFLRPELQAEARRERVISDLAEAERLRIRWDFVRLPTGKYTVRHTTHAVDDELDRNVRRRTLDAELVLTQTVPQELPVESDEVSELTMAQAYFKVYGRRLESANMMWADMVERAYIDDRAYDTALWLAKPGIMDQWAMACQRMDEIRNETQPWKLPPLVGKDDSERWLEYWFNLKVLDSQDRLGLMDGATTNHRLHKRLWPELTEEAKKNEARALVDATLERRRESRRLGYEAKLIKDTDTKCNPYPTTTVAPWPTAEGKAPVKGLAGISVEAKPTTDLIALKLNKTKEKTIIREIMDSTEDSFIYAKQVTNLIKQDVPQIHKLNEVIKRFTKAPSGLLVPT